MAGSSPTTPPDPGRRVEPAELPRRTVTLPVGAAPLGLGLLIDLLLFPILYGGAEQVQAGTPLSLALPAGLVLLAAGALGLTLYGIVALAVGRAGAR